MLFNLWQFDLVLAYTQAPVEINLYMELPQGFETKHGDSKDHVLKLNAKL